MANRQIKLSPLAQENGNLVDDNLSNNRRFRNIIRDGKGNETSILQTAESISLLASSVTEIEGRVTENETSLIIQANQIATKVEQSTFDTLSGRVSTAESSITQQAGQIALKADQTTVNGINTRLNTAEQLITPTAITSTVRSSTEYTNDLGAKVSTNEVISRINQTAEAIKIQAGKISLEGLVTVNSRFKILADGSMEATNGVFNGSITADSGSIADFSLIDNYATIVAGTSGKAITAGSGSNRVGMSTGVTSGGFVYSFWAGNDNPLNAPFRVLRNGGLRSTDAVIAGWTMSGTSISRGNTILSASGTNGTIQMNDVILSSSSTNGFLQIRGTLVPSLNDTYSLGFSSLRFNTIFLGTQPNVSSDIRLKENVKVVENEYKEMILNTEIIEYNLIGSENKQIGINANKFHEQFGEQAELITKLDENGYYGADYVSFVPMLIKTVQSQQKKIDDLEERIRELESKASCNARFFML